MESVVYTAAMGFDKKRSLEAFKTTVYPVLRANCSGCHSTQNTTGSGAQAPLHSDVDVNLAHEDALTRVNFREPAELRGRVSPEHRASQLFGAELRGRERDQC